MVTDRNQQAAIDAEAAVWIARLHSSARSSQTESAFRRWLTSGPAHAEAFERATAIWDMIPEAAVALPDPEKRRAFPVWGATALAASIAVLVLIRLTLIGHPLTYDTAVGEQRVVQLSDRSQIALNTDSEVSVRFSPTERRVVLEHGEALFDVEKDSSRPFLVQAGDEVVRAIGTKFIVRHNGSFTSVALIEGHVQVFGPSAPQRKPLAALSPGQRVTVSGDAGASLDAPSPDVILAWRRGEVLIENLTLLEAAQELNRYNHDHLIVADPSIASLRVSGVFSTNDVGRAAAAIAKLHHLRVERDGADYKLQAS